MRLFWGMLFLWCCLLAPTSVGADSGIITPEGVAGPDIADLFNPAAARRPTAGEWLEYRVAFPVDPLENSLRTDPASLPGMEAAAQTGSDAPAGNGPPAEAYAEYAYEYIPPIFEPAESWRIIPLRLEIQESDAKGCNAILVYGKGREEVYLPAAQHGAEPDFLYDNDGGGSKQLSVRIGGADYAVDETRRSGIGYGFVRWVAAEAPFGVVRFATAHVDLMLVGQGNDTRSAPDFPLRTMDAIAPALGHLYRPEK